MNVKAKYDEIGKNYNSTRQADPYLVERIRALLLPQPSAAYLDIGCGTGNYTSQMNAGGARFIGIDPSERMLQVARSRHPGMDWRQAAAEQLPLENESMDGALATLTLHHWSSLLQGFQEVHRVLKKGSRFLIFTSTNQQTNGYWLNHYFPEMLANSCLQMPELSVIETALSQASFSVVKQEPYFILPDLKDQFLYCGKHQPELYFNPAIRAGISSFSALSNSEEVKNGLAQIKVDMASGKINEVMDSYANDLGDYLFILAEKN